jgi:hypothetical protein
MRDDRGRTKKLTVAFHFYRTSQAGWKCDQCRRQGLDVRRRCGFLTPEERGPKKLVWVRGRVSTEECPKSLVTPASVELLEKFLAWKFAAEGSVMELPAKEADAILILEAEWRAEAEASR